MAAASRIRWDRLSRVALLAVLAMVVVLYIGPVKSFVSSLGEAKERRAEVAALQRENDRLRARKAALNDPHALEAEARRQGMVRPGERSFAIEGLPED